MNPFGSVTASVREINRKYAKPEIEITPFVKFCLLSLRIYLLIMVGLMVYALVKQSMANSNPVETPPAATATQPAQVP
jgi:biopolymer transport protein ExbD